MPSLDSIFPEISVKVGENFEITLYSQPGTGFTWFLSGLPQGIVLLGDNTTAVPPSGPGSKVRQVFTFAASSKLLGASNLLSFELLRPWEPTTAADRRGYKINVEPADHKALAEDLSAIAGKGRFVAQPPFVAHIPVTMLYGFPPPDVQATGVDAATGKATGHLIPIIPYGFPTTNGQPGTHTVVDSAENCHVKYGFPYGVSTDPANCVLKYGFPVYPLYAFPAGAVALEQADPASGNCTLMYGVPAPTAGAAAGVSTDPSQCLMKYAAPKVTK